MTRLYYFAVSERGIEGGAAELGELAVGLLPGCRQAVSWVCSHLRAGWAGQCALGSSMWSSETSVNRVRAPGGGLDGGLCHLLP